jgi:hypothetical protein
MTTHSGKRKLSPVSPRHAIHGLSLPASTLKALQNRGVYCRPGVSIEHQHLARRYVLRGVESGGAVVDMGRACADLSSEGAPLAWAGDRLHRGQWAARHFHCRESCSDRNGARIPHLRIGHLSP